MVWSVELTSTAQKQLKKLDRKWQVLILDYLEDEIAPLENPRTRGKALGGDKKGLWRYRVGDYRILCQILNSKVLIVVVTVAHRKKAYRD